MGLNIKESEEVLASYLDEVLISPHTGPTCLEAENCTQFAMALFAPVVGSEGQVCCAEVWLQVAGYNYWLLRGVGHMYLPEKSLLYSIMEDDSRDWQG